MFKNLSFKYDEHTNSILRSSINLFFKQLNYLYKSDEFDYLKIFGYLDLFISNVKKENLNNPDLIINHNYRLTDDIRVCNGL